MRRTILIVISASACLLAESPRGAPVSGYTVVRAYPHDPRAFTQGLVYQNGFLYEGTGQNGQSDLRKVELATGKVLKQETLDARYFGEGITIWKDRIYQLTWTTRIGFIYERDTFKMLSTFIYPQEGWGLTHDGKRLIASDGSSTLFFRDPDTFRETGRITVRDGSRRIERLNELEFVRGEIWANVWSTDRIVRVNPATGAVTGWIDLSGILPASQRRGEEDVLNGIAFDAATGRIFVTGKWWPKVFEIRLTPKH